MIYAFVPYGNNGNLAKAYNDHCELVPNDNDWIILWDADVMVLTPRYQEVMEEAVKANPEYELFTCYTNRVKCKPQLVKEMFYVSDIKEHRNKAVELYKNKRRSIKNIRRVISGHCMMFQKKTWKKYKFRAYKGDGMFGVDTLFSRDILRGGGKIGLIEAVYAYHYYRFNEGTSAVPYKDNNMNEELKRKSGYA